MHLTHPTVVAPRDVPDSVVVVGAGLAGAQTVAALRKHGFAGRVTLLGDEGVPPYDRPPLSKELFSRPEPAWLAQELAIELDDLADETLLDDGAVGLVVGRDGARSVVRTRSGRTVVAGVVVLACGSQPVRPPGWDGALVLHGARDAALLRERLSDASRLVCVGAGWIGAEVAGAAVAAGCSVSVVEAAAAPLSRQLGDVVGASLAPWYAASGVELVTSSTVTTVTTDGVHVVSAEGAQRFLPADVVLAAVGARPATDWLREVLPLGARGAIPVDSSGRVLVDDDAPPAGVFAVGDCATREDAGWGHVPGGHWSAALLDPDRVARAALGLPTEDAPAPAPYVFSRQLGHDLALFGLPDPARDRVVLRGDPSVPGGAWSALYVTPGGAVTGVLVVDSPREVGAARRLLAHGPVRVDLARAADPGVLLRSLVPAAPRP